MTKKDIYQSGFWNGYDAAMNVDVQAGEDLEEAAFEAEENARQYSPFEFFASEINRSKYSDELWDIYDSGVAAGIRQGVRERKGKRGKLGCSCR